MILFRAEAILASSISKFGKIFTETDREDLNSSNESTISTSLIHNIASDGKSEQVVSLDFWIASSKPKMIVDQGICQIAIPIFAVFAVGPCSSAVIPPAL